MSAGKTLQTTWTAPPRAPIPEGWIYCKIIMSNIPACNMQDSCRINSCPAKGADYDH